MFSKVVLKVGGRKLVCNNIIDKKKVTLRNAKFSNYVQLDKKIKIGEGGSWLSRVMSRPGLKNR